MESSSSIQNNSDSRSVGGDLIGKIVRVRYSCETRSSDGGGLDGGVTQTRVSPGIRLSLNEMSGRVEMDVYPHWMIFNRISCLFDFPKLTAKTRFL